ncbi:unnamed protein product [Paramecium sonneborni]|uniref:Uncharacterized protein n=1 Tax=Paramecium sonneborni TaxID=65129 RepID=A0A8S1KL08_9CILI|nr:unnamed protein product [Paramecium sonneborni]
MLSKKDQIRKLIDNQFYQGNVMSIKQTLMVNNESYENEFLQKPPSYQFQYLQLDRGKLQSINAKESSRTKLRNNSVSNQKNENEINLIQQLKLKISKLQSLLQDLFSLLKQNEKDHNGLITELHQRFISIIKNNNETQPMNQLNFYKQNGQIYGLSTNDLNDCNLTKETQNVNENIKEISIFHYQGICKMIKLLTFNHQSFLFGEIQEDKILQEKQFLLTQNQSFKSIFFDQGESNQLTGFLELNSTFSIDSIQQQGRITDEFNQEYELHDINMLTNQGNIVGAQGIYRKDIDSEIQLLEGKPFINSSYLNSEINDCPYEIQRQLYEFEVHQNKENLTIDKITLKYSIINKLNQNKTKLQIEIGKLKDTNYQILKNQVQKGKNLSITYSNVNDQNSLTNIELI